MKSFKRIVSLILIFTILFSFTQLFFVTHKSYALSASYTQYVKTGIENFPVSYQARLQKLKELHPNWEFKAYYTGIPWSELTSSEAENRCLRNTIYKNTLLDPAGLCIVGHYGDANYYCASAKMVNYYLDPRNFLKETQVFQFLDLTETSSVTRQDVVNAVSGTYLAPYVDAIVSAAQAVGISPLTIVSTIFQEIGRYQNPPLQISGQYPGYEGYYNFYNYGATDGPGAVQRGMEKAKELGWNSPTVAIMGGAQKVLAGEYISKGQITKYFYKFDVVGNEILRENMGTKTYDKSYFFSHQYMTNLRDPSAQAGTLYNQYRDNNKLDSHLTFVIPVYTGMPSTPVQVPTTLTAADGELYFVDCNGVGGVNLRTSPSTSASSLGSVYRNSVVAMVERGATFSKIKVLKATTNSSRVWAYGYDIGYMSNEYLTPLSQYSSDVTPGGDTPTPPPTPPTPTGDKTKVDGTYLKTIPSVTGNDIKSVYSDAVIKDASGTVITDLSKTVSTEWTVTTSGTTYTIIKVGDTDSDGQIMPADYVRIKNKIMGNDNMNASQMKAADVDGDGQIMPADYVKIKNHIMQVSTITL